MTEGKGKVSIRRWVMSAYLLLAVVPLVLMGVAFSLIGGAYQIEHAKELQLEVARRAQAEITGLTYGLENSLLGMLDVRDLFSLSEEDRRATLSEIRTYFKDRPEGDVINLLVLIGADGTELARASRVSVYPPGFLGYWTDREEYLLPFGTGLPYYGPVRFDEATREPVITEGLPVPGVRGEGPMGVLVAEVRLKKIWDRISELSMGRVRDVYVVDSKGRVVAHHDSSVVLRGTRFNVPGKAGIGRGLSGSWAFLASDSIDLGTQKLELVTERPLYDALSLPVKTVITTGVFFVVSVIGIAAFGYLFVKRVIRPIEGLADTAGAIGGGDLGRKAEKLGDDELGVLAETFNSMASTLVSNIDSLEHQISERVEAEGELASEKERLSVTLRSIGDGVIATGTDGRVILVNDVAEELTGCDRGEALGRMVEDVYKIEEISRDGMPECAVPIRHRLISQDGSERFVSHEKAPIRDAYGEVIGEITVFRDVTEEKKAEDLIRKQNSFLNSLLESITNPFYVIDVKNYTVKVANSAAHFGPLDEKSKCFALTHRRDTPCEGEEHPCTIREVLRTGRPVRFEHIHYNGGNEPLYIEVHGYPVFDSGGRVIEVIEYTLDITLRKKQEEKLLRASSLEAIGRLAAGVAHEINTPLTNASLSMEILLAECRGEAGREAALERLGSIERNIEKASKIAQELLWFSRQKKPEFVASDINFIIDSSLVICEWMFKGIEVVFEKSVTPPVVCDPLKLEQAFINVISNSVDAMSGGGRLGIRTSAEGGNVMVEVSDTGVGIDEEEIERVFEPFFTTKSAEKGTGLGLAIFSEIIRQHNGEVSLRSTKGEGTTIIIRLPAQKLI